MMKATISRALPTRGERNATFVWQERAHAHATHAFLQTTFFAVSKQRVIASSTRHLPVTEKNVPPIWVPPLKSARFGKGWNRISWLLCGSSEGRRMSENPRRRRSKTGENYKIPLPGATLLVICKCALFLCTLVGIKKRALHPSL